MKGYVKGRAIPASFEIGWSSNNNPRVGLSFEYANPATGEVDVVTWYGNIGDKVVTSNGKSMSDITFESLVNAGMTNDDMSTPVGLGSVDCSLVLDEEDWEDEETGKSGTRTIVRWVNKPQGPRFAKAMTPAEKAKFANEMKAKLIMFRKRTGAAPATASKPSNGAGHPFAPGAESAFGTPGSDEDIPF